MPRVYVSLPLTGPAARLARDLLRGMQLAAEGARGAGVELVALDSFDHQDRDAAALRCAERAAGDAEAIAYLGDFHSSQVHVTQPVLGAAGLLQVAPVATWVGLGGATLVRLSPHDGIGAEAIAAWLSAVGVGSLLVVHDHDEGYGRPVGALCAEAARAAGVQVSLQPIWDEDPPAEELAGREALLYVGVAGSGAVGLWHGLHQLDPGLWLLGSEGLALPWFVRALEPAAAERTRIWVAQRASFSPYGYEALALVLDALAAGASDRASVVEAVRATRDRDSVIGPYSLDADGHTTSRAYGRVVPLNGQLVWDLD